MDETVITAEYVRRAIYLYSYCYFCGNLMKRDQYGYYIMDHPHGKVYIHRLCMKAWCCDGTSQDV